MQVSDRERQSQLDSTFRDIATIVADKCINPDSKRPYTVGVIERAMKDIHYSVKPSKGSKQQALEVIRLLQQSIPIDRARMRLKIQLPPKDARRVRENIIKLITVEVEEWSAGDMEIVSEYTCYDWIISTILGLLGRSWALQAVRRGCERWYQR